MQVNSGPPNVSLVGVRLNGTDQPKKTEGNFAHKLDSAKNSPDPMRTTESKSFFTKFLNLFKPNPQKVIKDKALSHDIRRQLESIKNKEMEILRNGYSQDFGERHVTRGLTTPHSVANRLLALGQQSKDNNDGKSVDECVKLFDKANDYCTKLQYYDRELDEKVKSWTGPDRITFDQELKRTYLYSTPKA